MKNAVKYEPCVCSLIPPPFRTFTAALDALLFTPYRVGFCFERWMARAPCHR